MESPVLRGDGNGVYRIRLVGNSGMFYVLVDGMSRKDERNLTLILVVWQVSARYTYPSPRSQST